MTIPTGHSTTTGSLLQVPQVRALLGAFPEDLFTKIESTRNSPQGLTLSPFALLTAEPPLLERPLIDGLTEHYFRLVHPYHPILTREEFMVTYESTVSQGLIMDSDSALCLTVLALGSISSQRPLADLDTWMPGIPFLTFSLKIILERWPQSFGPDIKFCQSQYLAAVYCSYLSRPLQSWRLCHMAATSLQHIWIQ